MKNKLAITIFLFAIICVSSIKAQQVVINEINYNSDEVSFDTDDWIELYNNNGSSVDISGWVFKDSDDGHIFTIPEGTILDSSGYLVLCIDTTKFKALFPDVTNFIGEVGFGLSGSGELVRLYDSSMILIDSLTYGDNDPWPTEADGNGASLSLKNPDLDNSVAENWAASLGHGTPGAINDVFVIPVELTSFTAVNQNSSVQLGWKTATETNNRGFEIERSQNSNVGIQKWEKIGYVAGFGTTTEPKSYSFVDNNISATSYSYRLKQIDFDGSFEYSKTIEINFSKPGKFSLFQNYPNPFNPTTSINFEITKPEFVSLKVYDIIGNEVATLVNDRKPAGSYEINFDASNLAGGVYFYKIQAGNFVQTKKMILLK